MRLTIVCQVLSNVVHKPQQHIRSFRTLAQKIRPFRHRDCPTIAVWVLFVRSRHYFWPFFLKRSTKGKPRLGPFYSFLNQQAGILHSRRLKKLFDGAKSKMDDKVRTGLAVFFFSCRLARFERAAGFCRGGRWRRGFVNQHFLSLTYALGVLVSLI